MSRDKGTRAPHWVAAFLARWWPLAEAVGSGRRGSDILNTPGIAWEVKTPLEFKPTQFVAQAKAYAAGNLPIVVYVPKGCGRESIENALAIVPLHIMAALLADGGYTPDGTEDQAELAKINDTLKAHGIEYPLNSLGVADLAVMFADNQDELHKIDPDRWKAAVRP